MYSRRRGVDSIFASDERLYLRYAEVAHNELTLPDNELAAAVVDQHFRFPDQSVNRSKYSEPLDVLFPCFVTEGVVVFPCHAATCVLIGKSPNTKAGTEPPVFEFRPTHVPLPGNYSHAEIANLRDGVQLRHNQGGKVQGSIKAGYRQRVRGHAQLVRRPSPGEPFAWLKRRLGR